MVGDQVMVILSNPRLVQELLDHRTATTSDRPPVHILDVISHGLVVPMMRYGLYPSKTYLLQFCLHEIPGELWKDFRRVLREILSREACARHLPIQRAEATQLMYDLLKQPEVRLILPHRYGLQT